MNNIKKIIPFLLVLLLTATAVSAIQFEITTIDNKITVEEAAKYSLRIINNRESEDKIRVFSQNYPKWNFQSEPLENPITFTLAPGEEKTTIVLLDPLFADDIGSYSLFIKAQSLFTEEEVTIPVSVFIQSLDPTKRGYQPSINVRINMPTNIDPKEEYDVSIILENKNILDIKDAKIVITSDLVNEDMLLSLGPKEEKTIEYTLRVDEKTAPQQDTLTFVIYLNGEAITNPVTKTIQVIGATSLDQKVTTSKGFLKTTRTIVVTNEGNIEFKGNFETPVAFWENLFTVAKPRSSTQTNNGERVFSFPLTLQPYESVTITLTENYIALLIILILTAVVLYLYFNYRSPVTLTKAASDVGNKEGGIAKAKIQIHLANRSKKPMKNIEITDKLPHILGIEKSSAIGTLQPSKILNHERKGSIIKWHIDHLDVGDERVITYRIHTNLSILGGLSLGAATATFTLEGKHQKTNSNRLMINL